MKLSLLSIGLGLLFLGFFGCSTPPSQPKVAPAKTSPGAAPKTASQPTGTAASPGTGVTHSSLPPGEYALLVESEPDGGVVVVNGIPVGKAPQRIYLPGTQHGFFRDQVSLKVRFLAVDAMHPSQTVEELMTPLDRIPSVVKFTPAGATRIAR